MRGGLSDAALNSFVGREADLELTVSAIAGSRLITISGTGGIGKTRLAREVVEQTAQA